METLRLVTRGTNLGIVIARNEHQNLHNCIDGKETSQV